MVDSPTFFSDPNSKTSAVDMRSFQPRGQEVYNESQVSPYPNRGYYCWSWAGRQCLNAEQYGSSCIVIIRALLRFELGVNSARLRDEVGEGRLLQTPRIAQKRIYEMKGPASIYMKPTGFGVINATLGNFPQMMEYPVQQPKKSRE